MSDHVTAAIAALTDEGWAHMRCARCCRAWIEHAACYVPRPDDPPRPTVDGRPCPYLSPDDVDLTAARKLLELAVRREVLDAEGHGPPGVVAALATIVLAEERERRTGRGR